MYAVIKTGGKQYRVSEGTRLRVEKLPGNVGDKVELSEVLMVGGDKVAIGKPLVKGAKVTAEVVAQARDKKVVIFKIRRRKTRMARNPRTGDPVEVAARPVPVFKPSKELRALVADESEPAGETAQGM